MTPADGPDAADDLFQQGWLEEHLAASRERWITHPETRPWLTGWRAPLTQPYFDSLPATKEPTP